MARADMTFVLAVLVSLVALFVSGADACNNEPTIKCSEACRKACANRQACYDVCTDTLKNASDTAEATVYALVASRLAKLKYEDTMAAIDQALGDGKAPLPAPQRTVVESCKARYADAHGLMTSLTDQLFACDFARAGGEYSDAKGALEACKKEMQWAFQGSSSQLPTMVSANLDLTVVAYGLGTLAGGK